MLCTCYEGSPWLKQGRQTSSNALSSESCRAPSSRAVAAAWQDSGRSQTRWPTKSSTPAGGSPPRSTWKCGKVTSESSGTDTDNVPGTESSLTNMVKHTWQDSGVCTYRRFQPPWQFPPGLRRSRLWYAVGSTPSWWWWGSMRRMVVMMIWCYLWWRFWLSWWGLANL